MQALASVKTTVGVKVKLPFWVLPLPRYNLLVNGGTIPAEAIVDLSTLIVPPDFDVVNFRLVDQMVRRELLGPGVYVAEFYKNDSFRLPSQTVTDEASMEQAETPGGQPATQTGPLLHPGRRRLCQSLSASARDLNHTLQGLVCFRFFVFFLQGTQPPLTPRQGLDYRGRVPDYRKNRWPQRIPVKITKKTTKKKTGRELNL